MHNASSNDLLGEKLSLWNTSTITIIRQNSVIMQAQSLAVYCAMYKVTHYTCTTHIEGTGISMEVAVHLLRKLIAS